MDSITSIYGRWETLKQRYIDRDVRMTKIANIRANNTELVAPGLFSAEWPKPVVANFIDAAAHDLSEVIAPLPAVNCNASNAVDDASRKRADKRTRIASYYIEASRLQTAMYAGADRYLSYGFLPLRIELDVANRRPHVHLDDPMGAYPEFDRYGNVTAYAKRWTEQASTLAAMFPEHADKIIGQDRTRGGSNQRLELVKWYDNDRTVVFLPDRSGVILAQARNLLGRVPVAIAQMPSLDGEHRGQFDDVLWVQLARAKMAMLKLEAAHKAVEAPIALPQDVQHLALGGDAIIRSATPEKIRRVELQVPSTIFAEDAALEKEMRTGSRYPEARVGNIDANIITGRGVQALMGGFDTQVKTAQVMFAQALQDAIAMCFELDEKVYGPVKKEIQGTENGQAYSIKYTPERDIKGDYTVSVDYGLMAGLDPNRALVWGLQARSDKLISRQFLRKNLPVSLNASLEEEIIDIEDGRDALKQALSGYVQAIPLMAQQGQDPGSIVRAMSVFVRERKKGKNIEDAVELALQPPEPPEQPDAETPQDQAGEPGGEPGQEGGPGEGPTGPDGSPTRPGYNTATGQIMGTVANKAGMPPGGRPDLKTMLSSLRSDGKSQMTSSVQRRNIV